MIWKNNVKYDHWTPRVIFSESIKGIPFVIVIYVLPEGINFLFLLVQTKSPLISVFPTNSHGIRAGTFSLEAIATYFLEFDFLWLF